MPLINNVINGIKNLAKPAASAATKIPDPPVPKAPNPWKKRAVKGTAAGLGVGLAGGYVGHSLFKAPEPPAPQYDGYRQTAGEIVEGVAKTAHKEDGTMDLMARLNKTAEESEGKRPDLVAESGQAGKKFGVFGGGLAGAAAGLAIPFQQHNDRVFGNNHDRNVAQMNLDSLNNPNPNFRRLAEDMEGGTELASAKRRALTGKLEELAASEAASLKKAKVLGGIGAVGGGALGALAGAGLGELAGKGVGVVRRLYDDYDQRQMERQANEQLDRLTKTANDMEIIQAISEITGASPEQIVNLMQQHPDQFAELVQELQGDQGGEQLGPIGSAAATGAGIGGGGGGLAGGIGGSILGAEKGFELGTMRGGSMPARLAKGMIGGIGGGVTGGLGGGALGSMLGAGVGGLIGAGVGGVKQLFGGNPRQGAGSVSDAPAGVDKSANANDDAMIQRLEKTLDAAMDVGNAYRAGEAKKEQQEKSAAELMADLEKTAAGADELLAGMKGVAGRAGSYVGDLADQAGSKASQLYGQAKGYAGNLADQAGDVVSYLKDQAGNLYDQAGNLVQRAGEQAQNLYGQAVGAAGNAIGNVAADAAGRAQNLYGQAAGAVGNAAGQVGDFAGNVYSQAKGYATGAADQIGDYASNLQNLKQLGAYGGTALGGAALGAGGMALANQGDDEEQTAAVDYAELDKAANALNGIMTGAKGLFNAGKTKVTNFAADLTGKNVKGAQGALDFHKSPAGENAMYMKGVGESDMHIAGNHLQDNLAKAQANQKKAIKGTAIAGGAGLAGIGTGVAINKGRDKQASEEDLDPAKHTTLNDPATAEGPAGQVGLEGYSEGSLPKEEEKEADEKADFMNELFKEAAAHILTMDVPKVKAYVDPMSRIKF